MVSNSNSDQIARKLVSNYSLTAAVIFQYPRILTMPVDKFLVMIVKDVEEMGIEKGSKAFARAFLQLSKLNRDTVKLKLEKMRDLGFTEEEVRNLVKRLPDILGFSEDTLRRKLKFLVEEWKLPLNSILSCPVVLHFSIEKRLKPRLNALRALIMMNKSTEKAMSYTPVKYLTMSSGDFERKVVSKLPGFELVTLPGGS